MPFNSHPNFSRALRAISGLGVFDGGNSSFQWNGLQALISATECVMLPAFLRYGGIAGSAFESHEPLMNWIILMSSSTMASTRPAARSANSTSLVV